MPSRKPVWIVSVVVLLACGAADKAKDEPPACMQCGATCGLVPICVCEPGTKKRPKNEFETTCEPICLPRCGRFPWLSGGPGPRVGCTSCCEEPCRCPSRVRFCKKLKKETVDEEVPVMNRKVAYLCGTCSGHHRARCCGVDSPQQRVTWWSSLTWWWPRATAH